jgi:hypothetical protein
VSRRHTQYFSGTSNSTSGASYNSSQHHRHSLSPKTKILEPVQLTQAQINEKIRIEIELGKRTSIQINLLMNKTVKWVHTQDFELYRTTEDVPYG